MRRVSALLASGACLLLAGCIRMDMTQVIERNGMTTITVRYDLTRLVSLLDEWQEKAMEEMVEGGTSVQFTRRDNIHCDEFMRNGVSPDHRRRGESISCKDIAPNIIELTATAKMPRFNFIVRTLDGKTIYLYRFSQNAVPGGESLELDREYAEALEEEMEILKPTGTVTVTMPAPVTRTTVGTVNGNTVTFDLEQARRRVVIRAEEPGIDRQVLRDAEMIEPLPRPADARDNQRRSDVTVLLNALYQFSIDHNGSLPPLPSVSTEICRSDVPRERCGGMVYLGNTLVPNYLVHHPVDPSVQNTSVYGTGYSVMQDMNGRVTVSAPHTEGGRGEISVTR